MQRAKSWGFPRWGSYDLKTEATKVRMCDHAGCAERGDYPAPKSRYSKDKWYFCQEHAAEYNRSWNYFEGMSPEEAAREAEEEKKASEGYARAGTWSFSDAPGATPERDALATLELDQGASEAQIKAQYRKLAKRYHPDTNQGDRKAAERFHQITAAYNLLTAKSKAAPRRTT